MISTGLLVYCLIGGAGYLLIVELLMEYVGRRLRIVRGIPEELVEKSDWFGFITNLALEFLFFVLIPTMAYAFFFALIPLTGVRAGLAAALFAFTLGAAPTLIGLGMRIRLPMTYLLYLLLSLLIKLGGCLAIIGYLYAL